MMGEASAKIMAGVDELAEGETASAAFQTNTEGVPELCATAMAQLEPVRAALAQLHHDNVLASAPVEASQHYKQGARQICKTLSGARHPDNEAVRAEAYHFDYDDEVRSIGKTGLFMAREIEDAARMIEGVNRRLGDIATRLVRMKQTDSEASARSAALRQHASEVAEGLT